ncbi:uncharacterized protein LOC134189215 [Corticium candelabrum]|uniref:uncharacterized protein LOC134189215 n=1 Tax=Corticium candelabrum TaxID=121492 RepID=UPI002E25D7E8|nr:uncharacterized protein LOC134189215 [Corticium candelabrum]
MQSDLTHSTSAKNPISCITVLDIKLHKGHNLNKTFWQKVKSLGFDNTIDPYISFEVTEPLSTANNAIQKSSIKENNENPIWEEEITIPVDISKPGRLQMTLWDSNLLSDSQISYPVFVDLNGLAVGAKYQRQTVKIHKTGSIEISLRLRREEFAHDEIDYCSLKSTKQNAFDEASNTYIMIFILSHA